MWRSYLGVLIMPATCALMLFALLVCNLVQIEDGTWWPPQNEMGEPCPFPFDPPQMYGQPMGQYHCPYCGAMVMAGISHIDYRGVFD